jgi:hypothetical protein
MASDGIPPEVRDMARHRLELGTRASPAAARNLVDAAADYLGRYRRTVGANGLVNQAHKWLGLKPRDK